VRICRSVCLTAREDFRFCFCYCHHQSFCKAHFQSLWLQGKRVTAVAAAKRHSLARTAEGDVWTWGHCGVSPRRVQLVGVRDVQRLSGKEVRLLLPPSRSSSSTVPGDRACCGRRACCAAAVRQGGALLLGFYCVSLLRCSFGTLPLLIELAEVGTDAKLVQEA
jgi:hypothetical protein